MGRLYITNTAPASAPAAGTPTSTNAAGWTTTTATPPGPNPTVTVALAPTKSGTNTAFSRADALADNPNRRCIVHAYSPVFPTAGTLPAATSSAMIAIRESNAAANMTSRTAIHIMVGTSNVIRSTILIDEQTTEWPVSTTATTATAHTYPTTTAGTYQAGDRLLFEFGWSAANTVTTSYTGELRIGGTAGDLAAGTADVTTHSPYWDYPATWGDPWTAAPVLGDMADFTFQTFTNAAGTTSDFHMYAAGRPAATANGIVIQLHGDGAGEFPNPTTGVLASYNTVALNRGMLMLSPRTPDRTGSWTWWENTTSPVWLLDLIDHIRTKYQINENRVWFMGYSGGAEVQTYFLLSDYSNRIGNGGNIMLGGGGASGLIIGQQPTTAFKTSQRLHWAIGENDTDDGTGWNAFTAAQGGYTRYGNEGFANRGFQVLPGLDHFQSENQGPSILEAQLAAADIIGGTGHPSSTGTSTAAGTPKPAGTATRASDGTGAGAGNPTPAATAARAGTGTGAGTGTPATAGSSSRSGSGTATATGLVLYTGTGTPNGTGTGTGAGTPNPAATADRGGTGTAAGTGSSTPAGTAAPSGTGTGTGTGTPAIAGTSTPTGTGTATGTGDAAALHTGTGTPTGNGTAAGTGTPTIHATAAPSGTGTTTTANQTAGTATQAGDGTSTAAGTPTPAATTARTGTGTSTGDGTPKPSTTTAPTGAGTSSSTGTPRTLTSILLDGLSAIHAAGTPHIHGSGETSSYGSAAGTATIPAPPGAPVINLLPHLNIRTDLDNRITTTIEGNHP